MNYKTKTGIGDESCYTQINQDADILWQKSICRWDEGIPLGSGRCGCLCWGTPDELHFSLDRTDIWDKTIQWERTDAFTYQNMVRLVREGDEYTIRGIFDAPYYYPAPTKLPAGKLFIRLNPKRYHSIKSRLSLKDAAAYIEAEGLSGLVNPKITAWIHAARHVGIITVHADRRDFELKLCRPDFGLDSAEPDGGYDMERYDKDKREISQGTLQDLKYPPAQYGQETRGRLTLQWFVQKITDTFSYGIVMAREDQETVTRVAWKIVSSEDKRDSIADAPKKWHRTGGNTGSKFPGWLEDGKNDVASCLLMEESALFTQHQSWWEAFWHKSSISLPDPFMQKQWYLTNYLFASASRKGSAPMPLQGVWTADDGTLPPWKGDYHHDLNTELCYSHYLKANHLEEGESFLDFLWDLRDEGHQFAREFYGTNGCCLPGVMTIDGQPLGGWGMYSLSPTNQVWIARCFSEYYRYTGDTDFLRDRAYPYLRETGIFILDLLKEQADKTLRLPVSSSPEIHDDTIQSWLTPMSNYDLALLLDLFLTLERFAKELGAQVNCEDTAALHTSGHYQQEAKKWQSVHQKLPALSVNEEHVLMLSPTESLAESHRHFSNSMAISPLELLSCQNEKEAAVIDACIRDYERLGTKNWVGYTFTWMAHLYAVRGDGDGAARMLQIFWEHFCGPNGFHLNGDFRNAGYSDFTYRPFTLEGNMFAADALQEMLFQMRDGMIRLFPAIPQKWKHSGVAFQTLRGEKGLLCSARITKEGILSWEIRAETSMTVTVTYPGLERTKTLAAGEIWCETAVNFA